MRCQDCGAPWLPVRRGECSRCGSDAGAASQGARAEAAEAKLRAVEALADEWETRARRNDPQDGPAMLGALFAARSLRAVLDSHPTGTPEPAPNTGEPPAECLAHAHVPWNNWCKPAASSVDDKAGEGK